MKSHIPLKSIYAFVNVVETGSMSRAAEQLNVSHSAVSQAIKTLESQLGTQLFQRIGRHITVNSQGKKYYQDIAPAIAKIIEANEAILNKGSDHRMTINMVNSLALHWWIPNVPSLQQTLPQLDIRISNRVGSFSLELEGVDIALVHDSIDDWLDYYCEKLADDDLVLVASPSALTQKPALSATELITRYPAISVVNDRRKNDWHIWCEAHGVDTPESPNNLTFNASVQAIHATIRNLGVLITHRQFVKDDIGHGLLVEIGEPIANPIQAFYFVCAPDKLKSDNVVALRHWLRQQFQSQSQSQSQSQGKIKA
ncbi:LysR substrate-binding domain-containing protein [Vibrio methylphosphonaticus]|uniref:LysR substrate-binding domain-containing protein n=1 Tax=Vibrio methylphosphonaticus TaxID=2946866 RepID=UPI00202A3558|nr:LysR substrate-binding domain-containing protein [Vibrio methylphosphonaticus]MCL9776243.1 LysR substrate-binding domain-containing protein [Vibrio methylphosphonaticus]